MVRGVRPAEDVAAVSKGATGKPSMPALAPARAGMLSDRESLVPWANILRASRCHGGMACRERAIVSSIEDPHEEKQCGR
jgi:hypothetical protein